MGMRWALAAALLSLGAVAAQALPAAPVQQAIETADVIKVAGGCGAGWYRNAYGVCRPMRRPPVVVAPVVVAPPVMVAPVVVAPRRVKSCPRGMVRNRYGRCVWY